MEKAEGNKNSPALSSTNLIMNSILHAPVQYRVVSSEACRKGSAGLQGYVNTHCHHPLANRITIKAQSSSARKHRESRKLGSEIRITPSPLK